MTRAGAAIVCVTVLAGIVGPAIAASIRHLQDLALRLEGPSAGCIGSGSTSWAATSSRASARRRADLAAGRRWSSSGSRRRSARCSDRSPATTAASSTMSSAALSDILLAFPGLLLAIAVVAVLGPSLTNVVLALTLIGWVGLRAPGARSGAARARARVRAGGDVPLARRRRGSSRGTSCPATLPALIVQATLGMGGAILAEASLSFLGLGVQPPTPSWGTMLSYGRAHLLDAPHLTIFPGLAIAVLVLGFNFLGDGLRDALDPTTGESRVRRTALATRVIRPRRLCAHARCARVAARPRRDSGTREDRRASVATACSSMRSAATMLPESASARP